MPPAKRIRSLDSENLLKLWKRLSAVPGGKAVFSRMVGGWVPYSGSIGARIQTLEPGRGVLTLKDCRRVRNHLDSIHAIALANLGELTTGVTLLVSLPSGSRSILTSFSIQYLKKARGSLTGECRIGPIDNVPRSKREISGVIRNQEGETVAQVQAHWLIDIRPQ